MPFLLQIILSILTLAILSGEAQSKMKARRNRITWKRGCTHMPPRDLRFSIAVHQKNCLPSSFEAQFAAKR